MAPSPILLLELPPLFVRFRGLMKKTKNNQLKFFFVSFLIKFGCCHAFFSTNNYFSSTTFAVKKKSHSTKFRPSYDPTFKLVDCKITGFKYNSIQIKSAPSDQESGTVSTLGNKVIPITVLSGFLGAGKTTVLQNLLENNQGYKIAIIVNDVATVNIDSRLIAASSSFEGIIELSNGCACCSLSGELMTSVSELITLSDMRQMENDGDGYDHIVIELSGVSAPNNIREKFQEASFYQMPLMERTQLDTMVTVVDCGSFLRHLKSTKYATPNSSPELYFRSEGEALTQEKEIADFCLNSPQPDLKEESVSHESAVVNLLIEQIEIADIILLNKVDICDDVIQISKIVKELNPYASISQTKFGLVDDIKNILGAMQGNGVAEAGVLDDHKDAVNAIIGSRASSGFLQDQNRYLNQGDNDVISTTEHSETAKISNDTDCSPDSILHQCDDPHCSHPSHPSHFHDHDHSHDGSEHSHSDFKSFVYRARRPFHPDRLKKNVLKNLPLSNQIGIADGTRGKLVMSNVLRSKGFAWLANSNIAAFFWSHAGISFEMKCIGRWWATLPKSQWPKPMVETILSEYDNPLHDDKNNLKASVGDRRQELVFIGVFQSSDQKFIIKFLDDCLLTDEEWLEYQHNLKNGDKLKTIFGGDIII